MKWMRMNMLEGLSPLGILATGLAIGVSTPIVRKGLRNVLVAIAKGAIITADQVKEISQRFGQEWGELINEVTNYREQRKSAVQEVMRDAGVGVLKTGMDITDFTRDTLDKIKEELDSLMVDAGAQNKNEINLDYKAPADISEIDFGQPRA